jgi:hypothetical protein
MAAGPANKWQFLLIAGSIALPARAAAQGEERSVESENSADEPERTELTKKQQSPLTEVMNIAVLSDVRMGIGETNENSLLVRVTALTPIRIVRGWKLVVWPTVPLRSLPPPSASSQQRVNGMGDILLRTLVTPLKGGGLLWGIGPVAQIPTAAQTATGTGKFSPGLVGVIGYEGRRIIVNFRPEHFRSVSGQSGRDDVEITLLTPSISYILPSSLNLGLMSETSIDWRRRRGDRFTVPVMFTVSNVTNVSGLPVNVQLGAEYFAVSPANGPAWSVRVAMALLFPIHREERK